MLAVGVVKCSYKYNQSYSIHLCGETYMISFNINIMIPSSTLVLTVLAGSFLAHAFGQAQLSASSSPAIDPGLVQSVPLYGVLSELFNGTSSESVPVSEWCREHAHALLRGINSREIWAIKDR